jgi:hypothetical protein
VHTAVLWQALDGWASVGSRPGCAGRHTGLCRDWNEAEDLVQIALLNTAPAATCT